MDKCKEEYPLVTVVAVCYNHERFVEETLDSIASQTYKNIELIIIDDCSTDCSVDVIKSWIEKNDANCIFVSHRQNIGLSRTLNEALNLCTGTFFKPIACDDKLAPDYLSEVAPLLNESDIRYAGVFTDVREIDENSLVISESYLERHKIIRMPKEENQLVWFMEHQFPAPGMVFRTASLKKCGGYDSDRIVEDLSLCLKLLDSGNFFILVGKRLAYYRRHIQNDHISLTKLLASNGNSHIENIYIFMPFIFHKKIKVRRRAIKKVLTHFNYLLKFGHEDKKRVFNDLVKRSFYDPFFVFLLSLVYFLPGYYWKKKMIQRF